MYCSSVAEFVLEKNKLSIWNELSDNSSRYKSKFRLRLIRVSARLMDALRDGQFIRDGFSEIISRWKQGRISVKFWLKESGTYFFLSWKTKILLNSSHEFIPIQISRLTDYPSSTNSAGITKIILVAILFLVDLTRTWRSQRDMVLGLL